MYIAFKWLFSMGVLMWGIMCCFDEYLHRKGFEDNSLIKFGYTMENITKTKQLDLNQNGNLKKGTLKSKLYMILFISSTIAIIYNKKKYLLIILNEIKLLNVHEIFNKMNVVSSFENFTKIWREYFEEIFLTFKLAFTQSNEIEEHIIESTILINKLKEINEERKNLSQMLRLAVEDREAVKKQLKLENVAKDRLLKHIQEMNKQIKENKTKYFNFQNLYVATHQENIFLRCRIKRLVKDKTVTEQNLMNLVHKVYETKNSELLAYCSRFIVHTKDNLLKSDVKAEIKSFLKRSHKLKTVGKNSYLVNELGVRMSETPKLIEINEESDWDERLTCIVESLNSYETPIEDRSSAGDFQNLFNKMEDTIISIPLKQNFLTQSEAFVNFLRINENTAIVTRQTAPIST